ncbi:hypothetical protein D083_2196 [Dickeya solani RNS 08.23.3.1.A]|nr:hypothetical protein D083_2196 [Dickeya solani RNS 08.23.3.1.A]
MPQSKLVEIEATVFLYRPFDYIDCDYHHGYRQNNDDGLDLEPF